MALQELLRPRTVAEAVELLVRDPDAKPLAGGATLVAMINARIVEPKALVHLAGIAEIQGLSTLSDGRVRIGAFTRHCAAASCNLALGSGEVVRDAASQIANATVRNMGTIGGSVATADPGLDYPPALVAARASVEIASIDGRRTVPAREFFVDWYATALQPGELVVAVVLPKPDGGAGLYLKHARVAGDFATASVAIVRDGGGRLRVAVGGCGPAPIADDEVDALLSEDAGDAALVRAGERLSALADPLDDVRGSAEYRRMLIPRLLARAVRRIQAKGRGAA